MPRGTGKLTLMSTLEAFRPRIRELAREHGVTHVRVFGSFGRGEATETSDVDLLVELLPDRTLFDLGGFQMDAEALLGRRVDVVTPKGLHGPLRDRILQEARAL